MDTLLARCGQSGGWDRAMGHYVASPRTPDGTASEGHLGSKRLLAL